VAAARDAAQKLGLDNCEFLLGDAEAVAEKLARDGAALDVAITDPPRKGCTERTLASLVSLAPRRIVMVSCNAATLARDLKFLESNGYITKEAVPIDMFPRTPHVECVCLMARTGK
ncbi:MAG: 23S rRNA (uracil(1939)-C(5))-methyltransferase RlmD, partial [Oscillospiraceae bacterium]